MTAAIAARKPAYYHGWNIVGACILAQLAALGVTLNCFSLFVTGWSEQFDTPISTLALSVTLFSLGCSLFTMPAGFAADRFPARMVIGAGLAGVALAQLLIGFAQSSWQIIGVYVVLLPIAICFSAAVPCQAVVSRWFVRRRGTAMGLCAFGLAMAGVIFPPIIAWLSPQVGWRATWWIFAGLIVVVIIPILALVLRDAPTAEEGADYIDQTSGAAPDAITIRQVLARPTLWAIVAVFLPIQNVSMVVAINMAPIAQQQGLTLQDAGLILSTYSVTALIGKFAAGVLSDRLGSAVPFALASLLAAGGALFVGFLHGAAPLYAAAAMIGLAQGHWTLLATATATEFGAESFGRAYGVISAFTPLGSLAPPVVAYVYERGGGYGASLSTLGIVAVAGCALALAAFRKRPA